MAIESIFHEEVFNGINKINIGVRISPKLKLEIVGEAKKMGITPSKYVGDILSNRNKLPAINGNKLIENKIELKTEPISIGKIVIVSAAIMLVVFTVGKIIKEGNNSCLTKKGDQEKE